MALFDELVNITAFEILIDCLLSDISMGNSLLLAVDNISDPIEPLVSWPARWDRYLSDATSAFALPELSLSSVDCAS